jgi:hypothetical protein
MPAIIIKRNGDGGSNRVASTPVVDEQLVVVIVKDNQIEVYTDTEAQEKLNKGA